MGNPKVSEAIIEILTRIGVKQVFGVVGDALNSITDAIRRGGKIQWIGVRHEEVAAYAAGAQAQLNGQLGVCAGTVGPGAIHLLNGLYDAKHSHAPVLAITGQVPVSELGTDFHQEVDLQKLFDDVSVYNHTVMIPEQMPRVAHLAIQNALTKEGVAHLCFPGDVAPEKIDHKDIIQDFFMSTCDISPTNKELEKAAGIINGAKKVSIFGGCGTRGARDQVIALAEKLRAPIIYSMRGKDVLEHDNPYAVGLTGLLGTPAGADSLEAADTIIMVGTDFPYRAWIPTGKKIIQIDKNPDRIARRTHVVSGLVGHAHCTLEALLPLLQEKQDQAHLEAAQKLRDHWKEKQLKHIRPEGAKAPIRPELVAKTASDLAQEDTIFTADTGMCMVWAARFLDMRKGQRLLASFNHGSMANALPQAIGAQALYPDRQVIAFCGDGGLSMLMGDLITCVSYNLPVKLIVFNNHRLGMVKLEMETDGYPEFGVELKNPNFAKVAEAIGFTGIHVTEPGDVQNAVKRALETDGPVLIDVETNPEELSFPPKFLKDRAVGFAISKIKEHLKVY